MKGYNFYLEPRSGPNTYIRVEGETIKEIQAGDSRMQKKFDETYIGKSISFLKDDFLTRMNKEGLTLYFLRNKEITSLKRVLYATETRISSKRGILVNLRENKQRESNINFVGRNSGDLISKSKIKISDIQEAIKVVEGDLDEEYKTLSSAKKELEVAVAKAKEDHGYIL